MRWSKLVTMIDLHAEGEIGRVATAGFGTVPGDSMMEKMRYINEMDDTIRRFTVFEPRGAATSTVNLLFPPIRPEAAAGFIVLQADKAHAMSGSNAMCVATALLETGYIPMREPYTRLKLDTPAGLVSVTAECRGGRCERIALDMPPSFVHDLEVRLSVPEIGTVIVDIAYGGVFYALVDAAALGIPINRTNARRLVELASPIKRAVNQQVRVRHPDLPEINHVSYVMFCERGSDPSLIRGCTVIPPGRCDRSPCGTGTAARLAAMYARGEVRLGDELRAQSIIDTEFQVELTGQTCIGCGSEGAVLSRISGRAWIFGMYQCALDPTDPFAFGFALSDTWGPDVDEMRASLSTSG
ncbi:proline racemase family protein [Bradyrhizobium uaiense]|uniref:Proline racemase n=1 Tax=Bradyrhizobium uaiense TaxID=2594946 RepID=A0A6P1BWY7_9BRAD|nr:proline racemase family protein [Bradyrhizobium uaiense]NEV02775.1 proline racemase [Bradyrhizobium uaiense]